MADMFHVRLNNEPICQAGVDTADVLSIIASIVRNGRDGDDEGNGPSMINIRVAGARFFRDGRKEHFTWVSRVLHEGDEVLIRVATGIASDAPMETSVEHPAEVQQRKRAYLQQLESEVGDQRANSDESNDER
jgi:hypothetical protein